MFNYLRRFFSSPTSHRYAIPLHPHLAHVKGPLAFQKTNRVLSVCDDVQQAFSRLPHHVIETTRSLLSCRDQRIGVCFSGGPAPGGHNVIVGLFDCLSPHHTLFGIEGGPGGLLKGQLRALSEETVAPIIHTGGFDFLGTDRTKIKSSEQIQRVKEVVRQFKLDGLVIIGGDDSNTNAALLAEALYDDHCTVVGVPKTIDGDLQVEGLLDKPFGFDTACSVYTELVQHLMSDLHATQSHWHIVKLMGRHASHVTLEVALQTRPTAALIAEDIGHRNCTLQDIVDHLTQVIVHQTTHYFPGGLMLIPEGLLEWCSDLTPLFDELNTLLAMPSEVPIDTRLSGQLRETFCLLPKRIQSQLVADRDAHGNIHVSSIDTEHLLIDLLTTSLNQLNTSIPFRAIPHFYGYEGRSAPPSIYDAAFTYHLGVVAGSLVLGGHTGMMASYTQESPRRLVGIPLAGLLTTETRHAEPSFVIKKTYVDLNGPYFHRFQEMG